MLDPTATPAIPVLDLFNLSGQTALVTGGTRGIGAACAIALAQAGANIILVVRDESIPCATLDALNALPPLASSFTPASQKHITIQCDLSDLPSVRALFPRALEVSPTQDEIHILVNCAGIQRRSPSVEFGVDDWNAVLDTNLSSPWFLAQAAGQHMVPRKRGKIVNFCSLMTFQGGLTIPAYAAAKGALGQLTKALSNEWSKEGVQVNGICPGYVGTDMNARLLADPTRLRQISERIPAGRWGTPEDFAGPVVFLASKASMYVCGELIVVDGGWMGR